MRTLRKKGLLLNISIAFLRKHKKTVRELRGYAEKYGIPPNVLIGIFALEITFRGWLLRLAEYAAVIGSIFLNILFKLPVRNFTIGKLQIGLTSILAYYGYSEYNLHSRHINNLDFKKISAIISGMRSKVNIKISADKIAQHYKSFAPLSTQSNLIIFVGEYYNGKFGYGLALEKVVGDLDISFSNLSP